MIMITKCIFLGDTHGEFDQIEKLIEPNVSIVQVGDFGIGFRSSDVANMNELNEVLRSNNSMLYAIRGNHDDPKFFDGTFKLSNIELLSDYSVIRINDLVIACIGGAISIDRKHRLMNRSYWIDEAFNLDLSRLNSMIELNPDINTIVTHTSPNHVWPHTFNSLVYSYAMNDSGLLSDLIRERADVKRCFDAILEKCNVTKHFYGHFHTRNIEYISIGEKSVKHECLPCNGTSIIYFDQFN